MLIRYIYETIANWKLQPFFVDDYKLSSERYSQHVCGAAIGLYGGVGDTLYIVRDDTEWTSRLYFADDYKLLVRILRPSGPICVCVGSLLSGDACFSSGVLKLSAHVLVC